MNHPASGKHSTILSITVIGVIAAILAALAEALQTPLTKLISADTGILMSVSLIFLGGGLGMAVILLFGRKSKSLFDPDRHIRKKDTWKIIVTILLALFSLILILIGMQQESAATASVLQNFITVSTVLFAAVFLREKIPKWLGIGVALIVLGSLALAVTNPETLTFSTGSLLIIAGCVLVGILTIISKLLSDRNPIEIVTIRGLSVGIIAFIAALCMGESLPAVPNALGLMAVGFIGSGLSPLFMMYGQRYLGAAKAGAIYGIYPLIGVLLAIPILGEMPTASLLAALILFIPGMYFVIMKNSSGAAAAAEGEETAGEGDVQFFASISERTKTGIRNQLTSFGLLIIAVFFIMVLLGIFNPDGANTVADGVPAYIPGFILGIAALLCGIVLLVLGKRVMAAVTFILMVPQMLAAAVLDGMVTLNVISGIFAIIFALILMTSKDRRNMHFPS